MESEVWTLHTLGADNYGQRMVGRKSTDPRVSAKAKLMLVVLKGRNDKPSESGWFTIFNVGTQPPAGTLFIDANPGELSRNIMYLYIQKGEAEYVRGTPTSATYDADFDVVAIPSPHNFHDIVAKMNEGQFLRLGLNDKGICVVPSSRRAAVLEYLGF